MSKTIPTNNTALVDEMNNLLVRTFLQENTHLSPLSPEMITKFLLANKLARDCGNRTLEQTQLLISKACDERCRENVADETYNYFIKLMEYVHLYDDIQEQISKLAFMETIFINDDLILSLHRNRVIFDELEANLFERLFISDIIASKFLSNYGKQKLLFVADGLNKISAGLTTATAILAGLKDLEKERKLLLFILDNVRDKIRNNYSKFSSQNDLDILKRLLTIDLHHKNLHTDEIPDALFNQGIEIIKKEAIYYNNLLPMILRTNNRGLREEFIEESGLDLFYIEELENHYCDSNNISREQLAQLR